MTATTADAEAFFTGAPLGLAVHRRVLELLAPLGTAEVRVTRSQVAYRHRRAFAWTWRPGTWLRAPAAEVVLSIALPYRDPSSRWKQVVEPRPGRWMHHLEVRTLEDVDAEVAAWLAVAWDAAS